MIEVIVVGEGPTEESFIRDVLAPRFLDRQIFMQPRLIPTSQGARGGGLTRDRVLRYLRNTLRERGDTYVTTFFDLYGLARDFPGRDEMADAIIDPLARASAIEAKFAAAVVSAAQCRVDRFLPHIQPYEFEALLFADTDRLIEIEPEWKRHAAALRAVRVNTLSPEHINDGFDTHPSARLKLLKPRFEKVLHGSAAAARIGLERIRSECRHFDAWLAHIETLQSL